MDFLTRSERSKLMSKVRGKNTKVELTLFKLLHQSQITFETHAPDLRGRPDVVFRDCNLAVFVDGDFWHGRNFQTWERKLNPFWRDKIRANIRRDRRTDRRLRSQGWSIVHVWGSDVLRQPERALKRILNSRFRKSKDACELVQS
jgi:DNA mismatch endonuclease (patch repair protein)